MRKPRVLPVVLTAVLSAALLFGGWSLYKHTAFSAPLEGAIGQVPGIEYVSKPLIDNDEANISVKLSHEANLRDVHAAIRSDAASIIGNRKLNLMIEGSSDQSLDQIWSGALFRIAEAMETKNYSSIPETMALLEETNSGLTTVTEMDETNVYITLRNGQSAKYIVLPRVPDKLGVWPNA